MAASLRPLAIDNPHARTARDVLAGLGAVVEHGLGEDEVTRRRAMAGANTIEATREASALLLLLHQFTSPVVYLLGGAALLAFWFQEIEEGLAIFAVLAVNALIGFVTELKAARSIEALRKLGSHAARVRRDGHVRTIAAEDLVPGDIVLIEAGDAVAADMRLVDTSSLAADESTVTGESVAVEKSIKAVAADARVPERHSMLFKGTAVTRGSGVAVVTATGLATELGRVSRLVEESEPGASPLERKLARLTLQLVWGTLALAAVLIGIGLWNGKEPFLIIEMSIALAVAAIPEGLPIIATLALARGMWRMAQHNALIERLAAVETLGATTVILTDKTGTLTENRMTVRRLWVPDGEIDLNEPKKELADDEEATLLLRLAVLCNDAVLEGENDKGSGDPMELALLRAGLRGGLSRERLTHRTPQLRKEAFDTATKKMATVHKSGDGYLFAIKGAPEAVLNSCDTAYDEGRIVPLTDAARRGWTEHIDHLGHHGLRVIACAMKMATGADEAPYQALTFAGLIALEDPARANVPDAIEDCRRAGIRVVMVTGDHAVTARSIGRAVGLGDAAQHVIEGRHVARLIESGDPALYEAGIFARVSPGEKLSLVRAFQKRGEVVAMTGDGVNDAPALRQADIGVAMGLRGTDVAREAAAMILLDDAFPSIVRAIREGRIIFGNIRRFVAYLMSCNLSEVLVVGLAVLFALPLPILPLQILYLNLITDVFPAFALALGEGDRDILKRPPRDPKQPLLSRAHWMALGLQSVGLAAATFAALATARFWLGLDNEAVVTVTFMTLAFAQLWHVFDMRHPSSRLLSNDILRNPWIWGALALCIGLLLVPVYTPVPAGILGLTPPTMAMWTVVMTCSLAPMGATQIVLMALGRRTRKPA
ncbi:cation-translocating P-type ATPase [Undibacter mobilis]|uniref:Cation-transporting P-type ATPase n=1 Tax=Undibacter mobilis TaxID=2292256 RepID=A0A371B9Y6_9BRAD|nr:cation-transporting P-type ATPase [Undibacter mobilis]RDV04171.1 cation-transporting P-type ATPase [Undibacter mobilis]